ncbi:unnamed protein product [Echinostoma caproni]|uniref:CTNNB1_binding domain-containing protein n=1 Tax=Echinostoma caproni TaxID=27848 RepID=A0A183A183_9TREM|nr:unnamed protein product [Echinostoma caproni]
MLGSTTAENLACTDEVKVYEDEGEEEEQQKSSENLTEDKVRLVIESETQVSRGCVPAVLEFWHLYSAIYFLLLNSYSTTIV